MIFCPPYSNRVSISTAAWQRQTELAEEGRTLPIMPIVRVRAKAISFGGFFIYMHSRVTTFGFNLVDVFRMRPESKQGSASSRQVVVLGAWSKQLGELRRTGNQRAGLFLAS